MQLHIDSKPTFNLQLNETHMLWRICPLTLPKYTVLKQVLRLACIA